MRTILKYGKEEIEVPKDFFEMADRLARDYMKCAIYSDDSMAATLGTIYIMGFMHATEALGL